MIPTYFGMGVVLLATSAWVLVSVVYFRSKPRWTDDDARKALYRDRFSEIESETKSQLIEAVDRAELGEELGVALLADLEDEDVDRDEGSSMLVGASLAVVVVALSVALYIHWGDPTAESVRNIGSVVMGTRATPGQLDDVAKRLNVRIKSRPQDRASWYYLALTHFKAERFSDAAEAFAMVQAPGDGPLLDVDVHWAQAAFLAAGGILDADARMVVDRIQTYRSDHPSVLELLTLDAVQRRQHERVVSYSDRALRQEISESQRDFFERGLVTARAQLSSARPHLDVFVDVRTIPKEFSWLLVYARSETVGPPLAVVKRPLDGRDSFNVTLDDAVSMDPTRPISSVDQVYVVARLSVTGTANAHPGDMERRSEILTPDGATVRFSFADDLGVIESN